MKFILSLHIQIICETVREREKAVQCEWDRGGGGGGEKKGD